MYIEEVVEVSGNKSAIGDQQEGPTDSEIDQRKLVGYALPRKLVLSVNDCSDFQKNMDTRKNNSAILEATFVIGKKMSSSVELPTEFLENFGGKFQEESGGEQFLQGGKKMKDNVENGEKMKDNMENGKNLKNNVENGKKMKNNVENEKKMKDNVDNDKKMKDNVENEKKIKDNVENRKKSGELTVDFKADEDDDKDDSFEEDNDEEESALFGNKTQSIFIRRRTIDFEGEDSMRKATELQHPDKWIAKKVGKRTKKLKKKHALSFFDILLSLFVVAPLVIGQWRGIWGMMDIYHDYFPEWLCVTVGTGLHLVFAMMRNKLHGSVVEKWRTSSSIGRVAYDFIRLVYVYVFCVACNLHWRGGWMIFDKYFDSNIVLSTVFTGLFATALLILRSFRNLIAPPFVVVIDEPERVFNFPTRYNVNTRDWSLYILDCAFSVGIVGSLVVFVWRGVWVLFEIHLFPENREYSAIGSLVIGYILVAVTFCLQPLMRYTCARLEGLPRLLAADAFLLLSFLGTVNVWRGIWTILDLWLLPDDIEMSCWITHIGCFIFLVLLNCSNSILVRGVYIDAEEEEGRCVVFPCHYLRLFFKIERQKKEARRQNLVAASKEAQSRNEGNTKVAENETLLNCTNAMPSIIPANPDSHV